MNLARFPLLPRTLLAVSLLAGLLASCGGPSPGDGHGGAGGAAWTTQRVAPEFALEDLEGKLVRLSDSAGRVRVIDFWATWCPPCIEEIPTFKELHARYGGQGLTILAISMDEGRDMVREFVNEREIPYTNLMGTEEVQGAYEAVGMPTIILVDRDGKIVAKYVGATPKRVLEKKVQEMLGLGEETAT